MDQQFASDNTAGICPEAFAGLTEANRAHAASYGDDEWTARAKQLFHELFERECAVFFVFNGTASNALALSSACRNYHSILCHQLAHVHVDECGGPEFFTGGAKVWPLPGDRAKIPPAAVEAATARNHDVHAPRTRALSLTQSTELGTVYSLAEIQALSEVARRHQMAVHMDGARFANAVASLQSQSPCSPADLTWRSGVDLLSFGGTKNGMMSTEAVVIFDAELAREFAYRVKQSGQLASKQRFAAAQWTHMLTDGAWLRHAAHANAMAQRLSAGLVALPGCRLVSPTEVNGVFIDLPPALADALAARGWKIHPAHGVAGYRLMCGWDSTAAGVDALIAAARELTA